MGGYPGAGKTTQAASLARVTGATVFSAGLLLREEAHKGSALGTEFLSYSSQGIRSPDRVVCGILRSPLSQSLAASPEALISDGFPKSVAQLDFLEDISGSPVMGMIYLDAPEEVLLTRASQRRYCASCGPARRGAADLCARCRRPLQVRYDDDVEVIRNRLRTYAASNREVVRLLEDRGVLTRIDGTGSPEAVSAGVVAAYRGLLTG
ncbi:nucleoside monophosphate kinase [Streptomyces sp. NPDC052016]|uniref:nucleoside monophosphate kinase n=1 Tax=Streptomyces sp. NPDC052016 TaxID=3365680 RepID=UPI0037D56E2B